MLRRYETLMFHPLSLFIGLRYSRARKSHGFVAFINLFSTLGIFLGVTALVIVSSVMNGFERELKQRILGVVPHLTVQPEQRTRMSDWQAVSSQLASLPGVVSAVPTTSTQAMMQGPSVLQGAMLLGGWPEHEQQRSTVARAMVAGDYADLEPGRYGIILGRGLAAKLDVTRGDQVRVLVAEGSTLTPLGRMPSQRLFTVVGLFELGAEIDAYAAYAHGQDLGRLLRLGGDGVQGVRLYLADPFDAAALAPKVAAAVGDGYRLDSWTTTHGRLFGAVRMEKRMMWLLLSLIVAVAAFNIVSALVMMVNEKRRDVAVLRTLGLGAASVRRIFLVQGMASGVLGALLGVTLGSLFVLNLDWLTQALHLPLSYGSGFNRQPLPVDYRPFDVALIALFSLLLCALAAWYPASRAAQVHPAEALRYE